MKTVIAAFAVLSFAGPVFAASPSHWQLHDGRASYYGMPAATGQVNIPNPSGGIPGN